MIPDGLIDLIVSFLESFPERQVPHTSTAPTGALSTILLPIATGVIGGLLTWIVTRSTERLKISSGFLNYKLQKLQEGLENIHKEEFEVLRGLSFLHGEPKLAGPSDLFPHIESAWNKWQFVAPYCFHVGASQAELLHEKYRALINEAGTAHRRPEGFDSRFIADFFDAMLARSALK